MTTRSFLKTDWSLAGIGLTLALLLGPLPSSAQTPDPNHKQHHPPDAKPGQAKGPLDSLERALEKTAPKSGKKQAPKKKVTSQAPSQGKQPMKGMMGMMDQMMGQMSGGQPGMQQPSSELPGYPGASHIYHIGATGYFLDHGDMLALTKEQLATLNGIKERSLLAQSSLDRRIEQGEEDLWQLTASDRPEIKSIEAKVKEIEALRGEQRISFIRDVGEAAGILTSQQRSVLLGAAPAPTSSQDSAPKSPGQMPASSKPSGGMGSMGDM